ncbi:MAG: hypothetical protein LBQ48_06300, partial [Oscillospiraceae bacterium]|nr:hypothetical protein [Oscillospiraceae bacterium]
MLKKVKSAYYKDCARQVIRTWNRFFAILVISAMGVAFFAGLRASGPDMRASADEYYDERRFFDYRLLSNIGFSDEDAVAVKRAIDPAPFPNRPEDYSPTGEPLLNEPQVTPAYSLDAMADGATSGGLTVRLLSLNKEPETGLNLPELLSGRRPASDSECLAEPVFLELAGIELGDTIRFGSGTKDKITQSLKYEEFTVVGTARSPLYVSSERGGNAVGSGRTESVLLLPF